MVANNTFFYRERLAKGSTSGTYTVTNNYATPRTYQAVDDIISPASDSSAQLGDVTSDTFDMNSLFGKSPWTYVGQTQSKNGIVAFRLQKVYKIPYYYLYTTNKYAIGTTFTADKSAFALCFGPDTRIRTSCGEVAVEDLRVGDIAVTSSGDRRPITWIGHRSLGNYGEMLPQDQWPVRIRAHAFCDHLPARDLFLSPGHPILVANEADGTGGVLVPAMCLINGTTVARIPVASITYWHVELDVHDILLAEGVAAESFLDFGCRAFFEEASDHMLHNPDFIPPGLSGRCRPVVIEGPVVAEARGRIDDRFAFELDAQCAWDWDESTSCEVASFSQ